MTDEKKTECVKVWVGERLFVELNRCAIRDDRKLSDFIGLLLERHVYGHRPRPEPEAEGADRCESVRSGRQ